MRCPLGGTIKPAVGTVSVGATKATMAATAGEGVLVDIRRRAMMIVGTEVAQEAIEGTRAAVSAAMETLVVAVAASAATAAPVAE